MYWKTSCRDEQNSIYTCALSFDDENHLNFHSYTKTNFLRNVFTQKAKKINPVYVRNTKSSLEQYNSFFPFLQKVNN